MEIKLIDPTAANISKDNPFAGCKLGRELFAKILTNVIASYPNGFVLAINNEWGTGKTTFVKMWQQHLENNDYKTIYFNAWENDFDHNPLVAIISELKELSKPSSDDLFKSILPKAATLSKHILPGVVKAIVGRYIDTESVIDMIEGITKGSTEIFEKEIDEYKTKKQTVKDFRKDLEKFVVETSKDRPLVFLLMS
jgi:predicted KAP-like P-loop ATPase